jgi:hypothetical protein
MMRPALEAILLQLIKRTLLWAGATLAAGAALFCVLLAWPDRLFAFSLGTGRSASPLIVRFHL